MPIFEVVGWISGPGLGGETFSYGELRSYTYNLYDELLEDISDRMYEVLDEIYENGEFECTQRCDEDEFAEFQDFVFEYISLLCSKKSLVIKTCDFSEDGEGGWEYTAELDIDLDKLYLEFLEA